MAESEIDRIKAYRDRYGCTFAEATRAVRTTSPEYKPTELEDIIPPAATVIEQTVPEDVMYYLKEGNSKEDLVAWLWELLSDEQKANIIKEAKQALEGYEGDEGEVAAYEKLKRAEDEFNDS